VYDDVFAVKLNIEPRTTYVVAVVGASRGKCKGVRIAGVVDIEAAGAGGGSSGKSAAYHSIRIGQAQQPRSSSTYLLTSPTLS
jgi:hypothetical protein